MSFLAGSMHSEDANKMLAPAGGVLPSAKKAGAMEEAASSRSFFGSTMKRDASALSGVLGSRVAGDFAAAATGNPVPIPVPAPAVMGVTPTPTLAAGGIEAASGGPEGKKRASIGVGADPNNLQQGGEVGVGGDRGLRVPPLGRRGAAGATGRTTLLGG